MIPRAIRLPINPASSPALQPHLTTDPPSPPNRTTRYYGDMVEALKSRFTSANLATIALITVASVVYMQYLMLYGLCPWPKPDGELLSFGACCSETAKEGVCKGHAS